MTLSLDYIANNALPCRTYLDFTNPAYSSVSGSNFTQLNLTGNTDYDFISTGALNFPQRGVEGITFTSTQKLSPRVSDIIGAGASSYSLLIGCGSLIIFHSTFSVHGGTVRDPS
jgi:hypothetical protein